MQQVRLSQFFSLSSGREIPARFSWWWRPCNLMLSAVGVIDPCHRSESDQRRYFDEHKFDMFAIWWPIHIRTRGFWSRDMLLTRCDMTFFVQSVKIKSRYRIRETIAPLRHFAPLRHCVNVKWRMSPVGEYQSSWPFRDYFDWLTAWPTFLLSSILFSPFSPTLFSLLPIPQVSVFKSFHAR